MRVLHLLERVAQAEQVEEPLDGLCQAVFNGAHQQAGGTVRPRVRTERIEGSGQLEVVPGFRKYLHGHEALAKFEVRGGLTQTTQRLHARSPNSDILKLVQ